MTGNNYTKNISFNFLSDFNELSQQAKVTSDYVIKNLTPSATATRDEDGFYRYYANYILSLVLKAENKLIIDPVNLVDCRFGTIVKVNQSDIFLSDFYAEVLKRTRQSNLADGFEYLSQLVYSNGNPKDGEMYSINQTINFLFKTLKKEQDNLYIDFDAVDKKLALNNYYDEPSIKFYMETINKKFAEKINNGQVEGQDVYIDYDEVMEIFDYVQNELQPKSEIKVKKRKRADEKTKKEDVIYFMV